MQTVSAAVDSPRVEPPRDGPPAAGSTGAPPRWLTPFAVALAVPAVDACIAGFQRGAATQGVVAAGACLVAIALDRTVRARGLRGGRLWIARALVWETAVFAWWDVLRVPPSVLALTLTLAFLLDHPHRSRRAARPAIAVATALFLVALLDVVTIARRPDVRHEGDVPRAYFVADPVLGYRPRPGRSHAVLRYEDTTLYDVHYTVDEAGRRVVPAAARAAAAEHLVLMGCSYTFGEGVEDDETIGARLATTHERTAVHVYASPGYGPHQAVARLAAGSLRSEVPQRRGTLVYLLLHPDHNDRALGSYNALKWGAATPRFVLDEGRLRPTGSFLDAEPVRVRFLRFLQRSPAIDRALTTIDAAGAPGRDRSLLVALLAEARRLYLEQFDGRFVVAVWPGEPGRNDAVVAELRAAGLEVIDLSPLHAQIAADRERFVIPHDGHPTGAYYDLVAEELSRSLSTR